MDLNNKQKFIEQIISLGVNVVEIFPNNTTDESMLFVANTFEPSMKTPTDDIQYNSLVGINVTDFVKNASLVDPNNFKNKFEQFIRSDSRIIVRINFSRNIRWFKYASKL